MTVKELIAALATMPENAEVFADDWNTRQLVREIHLDHVRGKDVPDKVALRIWKTDEELFEEERQIAEHERAFAKRLLCKKQNKQQ